MASSLQAQITRRAISPRFAIRIFLNIRQIGLAKKLLPQRHRDTEKSEKGKTFTQNNNASHHRTISIARHFLFSWFSLCLCVSVVKSDSVVKGGCPPRSQLRALIANNSCPYSMGALFSTSLFTISPATSTSISFINF